MTSDERKTLEAMLADADAAVLTRERAALVADEAKLPGVAAHDRQIASEWSRRAVALRAALRRGTCGTCKHAEPRPFGMDGWVWCNHHMSIRRPADGCILHYLPTEPTR